MSTESLFPYNTDYAEEISSILHRKVLLLTQTQEWAQKLLLMCCCRLLMISQFSTLKKYDMQMYTVSIYGS